MAAVTTAPVASDVSVHASPPIPSVITALGLRCPHDLCPGSHVAWLLTDLLPGFASDASLDEVVQHVISTGHGQALVDCATLDDSYELVDTLKERYGLARFPPDRLPVKGVASLWEWRIAALLQHARRIRQLERGFAAIVAACRVYRAA